METEKDIFNNSSHHINIMEDNKLKLNGEREELHGLDQEDFLKRTQTENSSFDAYVEILFKEIQKCNLDLYKSKADAFLRKNAGISYEDFLRQAKPEEFKGNDYGNLQAGKSLRRKLFEYKVILYLSALDDSERNGCNVEELLKEIEKRTIPNIKKEEDEPIFKEILKVLRGDEKRFNRKMANLLRLAYSGDISLEELRDRGCNIVEEVMDIDPKGYDEDVKYTALKEVYRQLDNLHDTFTRKYFAENKEALLRLEKLLLS